MADAGFDALVIGGGTHGLIVANYLAKYGGMKVGLFEARPELGGGLGCEEVAPGFVANTHAASLSGYYTWPLERDLPLKEKGFEYIPYEATRGVIFKEDNSCLCIYSSSKDPTGELTAGQIQRFSSRDADTWLWLSGLFYKRLRATVLQYMFNPPSPPGVPSLVETTFQELVKEYPERLDPSMAVRSEIEFLRDLFESDAVIAGLSRLLHSATGTGPDVGGQGMSLLFRLLLTLTETGTWRGGTHSLAHVLSRIFVEGGGEFFTKQPVKKVIIENGVARGIRLADGTEVEAKKLVVSTLDPASLCFGLIGKEHLGGRLARRVANLERWRVCITWYGWAVHELPNYQAAQMEPDINRTGRISFISKDPEVMIRNHARRRAGLMPDELSLSVWAHTIIDKTQAPDGKHTLGSEEFVLPAPYLSDDAWKQFKLQHAEDCIREWQRFAPNMTWDNVIAYLPLTPIDCTNCDNFGPEGNWAVIDHIPSQMGRNRPVPELAQYRTPIKNLYATGAAWHYAGGAFACGGYNCYKVIAEDFKLARPWEKQGRPF